MAMTESRCRGVRSPMRKPLRWKIPEGSSTTVALRLVIEIEKDFASLGIVERGQELFRGGGDFRRSLGDGRLVSRPLIRSLVRRWSAAGQAPSQNKAAIKTKADSRRKFVFLII